MMLQSGLPISQSLRLLTSEQKYTAKSGPLITVAHFVESGIPLSRALELGGYNLKVFAVNLISVGETSGTLPENLQYIAAELKQRHGLRKQIIHAMIYPAIIIMATLAISVFLVVVIFPKILPIFASLQGILPWSTRTVLVISHVLGAYGLVIVVLGIVVILFVVWLQNFPGVARCSARIILHVPVIGRLTQSYQLATSCRTLGLLLHSDVRIIEALSIVTRSTEQKTYQVAWAQVTDRVETGQLLSVELGRYPALFPPLLLQMISVGESTGNLSHTLRYLGDLYEGDVNDITKNLTALLEPILMLVMGLVVGFIAISIITPIYGITEQLHR